MKHLRILIAVFIGTLTLMSNPTLEAQPNYFAVANSSNNATEVTVRLNNIEHQSESGNEVAGKFHVILKVGNGSDTDILYNKVISISLGDTIGTADIITKEVPNSRLEYSSLAAAQANTQFEALAKAVTGYGGGFAQRAAPNVRIEETSLNIDEPLEIILTIEDGGQQSTLILRGTITVE